VIKDTCVEATIALFCLTPEAFILKNPDEIPDGVKPSFQVVDGSTIQIIETQNAFQRSLAQNAFSKKSIDTEL
jgi:hypothetical protein